MKTFVLSLFVLIAGTFALKTITQAETPKFTDNDLGFVLSDSDLDRIKGMVDERIEPTESRISAIEAQILELQTKMADCNLKTSALIEKAKAPKAPAAVASQPAKPLKSNGSSGGGSTGTVVQNVYQPVPKVTVQANHWSHPGDITSHLQTTHGQSVAGLSIEEQLTLHDSIHEGRAVTRVVTPQVTRTVTRSNVQTSNCPGGVCPTNSTSVSRTYSGPRVFPLLRRR